MPAVLTVRATGQIMGVVTIQESADERSIVTPGLRLRFRWTGDRWTHAIDLGPGPELDERWERLSDRLDGHWLPLAESIEWESPESSPEVVVGPVFQELHFQEAGQGTYALLVGRAGPHHFSGSFLVTDRMEDNADRINIRDGLEGYLPTVKVDIADRCSAPISSLATSYRIVNPLRSYPIVEDWDETGLCARPSVLWESGADVLGRHDFAVWGDPPARLYMSCGGYGPWEARVVADLVLTNKTQRYSYSWFHDCSTGHFLNVLRRRDPEYDAHMRRVEAEREQWKAEERRRLEDPELQDWLKRMGIDPKSYLDD